MVISMSDMILGRRERVKEIMKKTSVESKNLYLCVARLIKLESNNSVTCDVLVPHRTLKRCIGAMRQL